MASSQRRIFTVIGLGSALLGQLFTGEQRTALEIGGVLIGSSGVMALHFPRAPHRLAPLPLLFGAVGMVRAAQEQQLALPASAPLVNMPGRGVRSAIDGEDVLVGSIKLFDETDGHPRDARIAATVERLEADGRTTMVVSRAGQFLGVIGLADVPRADAAAVIARLRSLGIRDVLMLTGDNRQVANRVGAALGVTDVRAELLPDDKLTIVRERVGDGIAMIGDGVNDAPALAAATVGIAMGGAGTAVALETADVALMGDNLSKLPFAVGLSRAARTIIRQNVGIALGVIGLLLVTSVFGLIQLSGAVVLHEGSTIVVVLNALRLLGYRLEPQLGQTR